MWDLIIKNRAEMQICQPGRLGRSDYLFGNRAFVDKIWGHGEWGTRGGRTVRAKQLNLVPLGTKYG